jgi:predicted phosphodiesterase
MRGKKPTIKGEIVRQYISDFPNTAKHVIATKIYTENKLLFNSVEEARTLIRYYTGNLGSKVSANKIEHQTKTTFMNRFGLPESDAKPFEPYILPKANNNILFLSDIHLPYHDINALTIALDYGKKHDVNTIYLNGDIMDCYAASFHEKDPRKRDMSSEFEIAREFIKALVKNFPNAKIFYKCGNHEMRWERYLRVKAPIILDTEEFRLNVLLKLREYGVEWLENTQLVKAGKLNILHGNEYKGGGGINVARTLWLRAGDNVIAGDKHKTQSSIKTKVDKSVVGTWSVGCMCELNPDYMAFNEWNLGFAHILISPNGNFEVKNFMIIDGKIC